MATVNEPSLQIDNYWPCFCSRISCHEGNLGQVLVPSATSCSGLGQFHFRAIQVAAQLAIRNCSRQGPVPNPPGRKRAVGTPQFFDTHHPGLLLAQLVPKHAYVDATADAVHEQFTWLPAARKWFLSDKPTRCSVAGS